MKPISNKVIYAMLFTIFLLATAKLQAQNCTVNAGVDRSICSGSIFNLDGGAAAPMQSNTIAWTVLSQPAGANVVIANSNSLVTNAGIAAVPGVYTFRLSVTCGDGIVASDNVVITVNATPATPVQSGTNSYSCFSAGSSTATLTGTAPLAGQTAQWSVVQGNGTFSSPGSSTTTFTPFFNADECAGSSIVVLRYTLFNGSCSSYVDRTYTFTRNYGAPSVTYYGGCSQPFVVLRGSCPGNGTVSWSVVSTPSGAPVPAFSPANTQTTTAGNLVPGTYVFRYTVTGGCNAGTADVTVVIQNGDPVVKPNAGADRQLCAIPSLISLSGSVPPAGQTVTWSQLSGGTSVVFASPNSTNTTASGLTDAGAPYTFIYQVSNGSCTSSDTISIYKIPEMTFGNTSSSSCNAATSGVPVSNFTYGSYRFNTIDTIRFAATFLSGPAGANIAITLNASNNFGSNIPTSLAGISVGQTRTTTLGAGSIYPNPQNQSSLYNLGISFTNIALPGVYRFRVSFTTKCGSDETELTITRGIGNASVNAGAGAVLTCGAGNVTLSGSLPDNFGIWSTEQMPAGASNPINAGNQTLRYPLLTGLIPGTYIFKLMPNPGPSCTPATFDYVEVYVSNTPPPAPNAGADKSTCAGTINLSGSAIPGGVNATWSIVSPAQTSETFSDVNAASTLVNNLLPNTTYTFRYTFTNGCGTQSDEVTITTGSILAPAKPTISISGIPDCGNVGTTLPIPGTLNYTINITPATPAGSTGTFTLSANPAGPSMAITSQSAGTANLAISNITQPTVFTIIYTVVNTGCPGESVADTLTFMFRNLNVGSGSAGANQQFCSVASYPFIATLNGTSVGVNTLWSTIYSSTGGQPVITSPSSATTTVSLPADGTYRFRFEYVSPHTGCPNLGYSTTQIITATSASVAQAGDDINFCNATGITTLQGTPLVSGSGYWSVNEVLSGTAPTITTPTSATSTLQFSGSGAVVLKWTAYNPSNPECGPSSEDLVTVTYYRPANAGNDQSLCNATSASLNALSALPASGSWSQVSGPNTASIADLTNNQTAVSNLIPGTYVFRWSVNAPGGCSTTDDIVVTISNPSVSANAGPDFLSCSGGSNNIQLAATPVSSPLTGTWSVVSQPAGVAVGSFNNVNLPDAIYNGVTAQGTYVFAWTVTDGACSSIDYVTVTAGTNVCVLPVELSVFSGRVLSNCQNSLNWKSETEINVSHYELERSSDAMNYSTVTKITARGSNETYSYTDTEPSVSKNFYRLKMVDRDGTYQYSGIVPLMNTCSKSGFVLQPNLLAGGQTFAIDIYTDKAISKGMIEVRNITGQLVNQYPVVIAQGRTKVQHPALNISAGMYLVTLRSNGIILGKQSLIIQ